MTLEALTSKKPALLGLAQSLCGLAYIALVVTFLQNAQRFNVNPPEYVIALVMLTLLVVSATIMGLIFLGVPLFLILKGNWPKALQTIGFTVLFSLLIVGSVLAIALIA